MQTNQSHVNESIRLASHQFVNESIRFASHQVHDDYELIASSTHLSTGGLNHNVCVCVCVCVCVDPRDRYLKTELLHRNVKHSANKYMVKETICFDVLLLHALPPALSLALHADSVLCHSKSATGDVYIYIYVYILYIYIYNIYVYICIYIYICIFNIEHSLYE